LQKGSISQTTFERLVRAISLLGSEDYTKEPHSMKIIALMEVFEKDGWTDEEVNLAIDKFIRKHKYPTFQPANILEYRTRESIL
jgi:hypothetical protein